MDDRVYMKKSLFVDRISKAFAMLDNCKAIEYRNFPDKYTEILRIRYECGGDRFIDVTADSIEAIGHEIGRILLGEDTIAEITNEKHKAMIKGWFEEGKHEAHIE